MLVGGRLGGLLRPSRLFPLSPAAAVSLSIPSSFSAKQVFKGCCFSCHFMLFRQSSRGVACTCSTSGSSSCGAIDHMKIHERLDKEVGVAGIHGGDHAVYHAGFLFSHSHFLKSLTKPLLYMRERTLVAEAKTNKFISLIHIIHCPSNLNSFFFFFLSLSL